ncbi:hypothetical protein GQX74_006448 [Glossina fuscipes]|nr:hypothetical protein GQX74_006448 [Glossina fuscipes]
MHQIISVIIALAGILALSMPTLTRAVNNQTTMTRSDFSTEFAKMILKRAKAAEISSMLDTKVNPCNDFYTYACGNWHHSNPAQLFGDLMTDKFQMLSKALDRKLAALLNNPKRGDNLILDKIKDFHNSCKIVLDDQETYKMNLKKVYQEFGEFPFLTKAEQEQDQEQEQDLEFNWWLTVAKIQSTYGKEIILSSDVMGDLKNNSQPRIYIGAPEYSTPESSTKIVNIVQEILTRAHLQKLFALDKKKAKEIALDMLKLERALKKGTTDERLGKTMESLVTEYDLQDLKKKYEKTLDIEKFLEISLNTTELPQSIYVYDESYLENLVKVLNETENSTITTYVLWMLIQDYIIDNNDDEPDVFCADKTKTFFNKYIDRSIYEQYRSERDEKEIYELWDNIKKAFRNELMGDKLDWISNSTREYALEKLAAMNLSINAYDEENFTDFYGSLEIDSKNYVQNIQNILRNEVKDDNIFELDELNTDKDEAQILSFTPAYSFLTNGIKIPVSMLQPRFFWDTNYPQAIKYATLGYLIAHEMIHGFDDDGRTFDKDGNSREWWDQKSTYEFEARRKCFQAQYHNYKYDGKRLPDSVLQAENIADNGAVKLAYSAYMNWLYSQRSNTPNIEMLETLPGLEFNNRQLFFINFAQVWCEDVQSLFKSHVASADTHAPGMYRVIAIPIVYILAIVPGLMPWESGYRFLSFCHVFGSVAPWCGSFVYHLFMNIERGESVYYTLLKLDMVGIWVTQSFEYLDRVVWSLENSSLS